MVEEEHDHESERYGFETDLELKTYQHRNGQFVTIDENRIKAGKASLYLMKNSVFVNDFDKDKQYSYEIDSKTGKFIDRKN